MNFPSLFNGARVINDNLSSLVFRKHKEHTTPKQECTDNHGLTTTKILLTRYVNTYSGLVSTITTNTQTKHRLTIAKSCRNSKLGGKSAQDKKE